MPATTITTKSAVSASRAYRSPEAACSLAEILDRILHLGVSLEGNLTIGVANVDLLYLDLRLLLASVDTVWPQGRPPVTTLPADQPLLPPRPPPSPDVPIRPGSAASLDRAAVGAGEVLPFASRGLPSAPAAGLARLVLTLVKLLHDVLERQAVRRMDGGLLTPSQIEDVGAALMAQAMEIQQLRTQLGLSDRDVCLMFGISDRSV
jgi:Gas vesicle protein K/Gas vesicle protein